jgi:UDP-3-O-[3-hydroxymyristoyl] N-acetylglucosamine deacetylase
LSVQRVTIAQPVTLEGVGLFSAQRCAITISPNETDTGLLFEHGDELIPAHIESLSLRPVHPVFAQLKPRCTSIGSDTHTIATIEHIMSALVGLGINDAHIAIDAQDEHAEIPILDGSALPIAEALMGAGLVTLDSEIESVVVRETIRIEEGDASIVIEPSSDVLYAYALDYPGTSIPSATVTWNGDRDAYLKQVAPARTFSLQQEAEQMQGAGLFTHLTTRDMLVIGDNGPIENTYRFEDECARHKLLDLIGDLALVGAPIRAKISATRSGHAMAHRAALAIIEQTKN